jgi:hypothetical protein
LLLKTKYFKISGKIPFWKIDTSYLSIYFSPSKLYFIVFTRNRNTTEHFIQSRWLQSRIYCTVAELIGNVALLITWIRVCDKQGYSNEVSWKLHEIFI